MSKPKVTRKQLRREKLRSWIIIIFVAAAGVGLFAMMIINTPVNSALPTTTPEIPIKLIPTKIINAPADGLHLGNPAASVKIDVWEDFQCPICTYYTENIEPQLIKNYIETGKVYYTFHFMPIIELNSTPPTKESHQAANAALCANEQGRFWDYHHRLFANSEGENVGSYTDARLIAIANALKLNMSKFEQCYKQNRYQAQIDQDYKAGLAKGAQGTPSIYVNGTLLTPGELPTYAQIAHIIDTILAGQ
jgi:protein-disulfide isomerase